MDMERRYGRMTIGLEFLTPGRAPEREEVQKAVRAAYDIDDRGDEWAAEIAKMGTCPESG